MVRVELLVLLLLGCRSQRPLTTAQPEGGVAEEAGALTPDVPAPTVPPDAAPDARPPRPDAAVKQDVSLDRPPPVDLDPAGKCGEQLGDYSSCSDRRDGGSYSRRFGELPCGLCRFGGDAALGSVSNCMMGDPDDTQVYCARSCFDCCHPRRGAPCETSADCCQPLRCSLGQCSD